MFRLGHDCPSLNIYACKKLNPVPVCFNAFLFKGVLANSLIERI